MYAWCYCTYIYIFVHLAVRLVSSFLLSGRYVRINAVQALDDALCLHSLPSGAHCKAYFPNFGTQKYHYYLYIRLLVATTSSSAVYPQNHDIFHDRRCFSTWKSPFAVPNSGLLVCAEGLGQSWSCCNVWVSKLWQILGLRRLRCLIQNFFLGGSD